MQDTLLTSRARINICTHVSEERYVVYRNKRFRQYLLIMYCLAGCLNVLGFCVFCACMGLMVYFRFTVCGRGKPHTILNSLEWTDLF